MKTELTIIGLMSGSSLDGIDIAAVRFSGSSRGQIEDWHLIQGKTFSYHPERVEKLMQATELNGGELWKLHAEMGDIFGRLVKKFITDHELEVDFIASHGHTIFHFPVHQTTCQIGCGAQIAQTSQLPTLVDFRSTDMAYGGQGAPLAPLIDEYLFSEFNYFLNLGGIANATFRASEDIHAFDICPCNQMLNYFSKKMNMEYDRGGKLASSGKLNSDVLDYLNQCPYYEKTFPKSLDNSEVKSFTLDLDKKFNLPPSDILHTIVEHFARKIATTFVTLSNGKGEIFTTGGGAHNAYLIKRLTFFLGDRFKIYIPDRTIVDFKEAILMALAGWRRKFNLPIFNKTNTGASKSCTGGVWYHP